MKTLVSIVEDNLSFQQALVKLIEESPQLLLASVYSSAEAALDMLQHPTDIAIIDIQLPGMNGIELIKKLHASQSSIQCIVCSMHDEDDKIVRALENGASGYLLKDSTSAQIKEAIDEVIRGGAPMSPYIARRVIHFFQKPKKSDVAILLSDREREVLHLLAKGLQYKEIAEQLYISHETVKKHLKNTYSKLHVQNKVEALNKWRLM